MSIYDNTWIWTRELSRISWENLLREAVSNCLFTTIIFTPSILASLQRLLDSTPTNEILDSSHFQIQNILLHPHYSYSLEDQWLKWYQCALSILHLSLEAPQYENNKMDSPRKHRRSHFIKYRQWLNLAKLICTCHCCSWAADYSICPSQFIHLPGSCTAKHARSVFADYTFHIKLSTPFNNQPPSPVVPKLEGHTADSRGP